MKKLVSLLLICAMVFTIGACGKKDEGGNGDFKVGVILVGDDTEGYTAAHMNGIKEAAKTLNIADSNIIWKYKVTEDSKCYDAAADLVASGCNVIVSNSYGHQTYMVQAAEEFSDVTFIAMTGDFAAISGVDNLKNAFTRVYESRYVSGVVAGLKLKELVENGTLTASTQADSFDADGNIKIGYVGAFNYAEVVSGYTAFYLGIKSVMPNVVMEVKYTNSWFDIDKEAAAAEALIANGCVIIGQHADSTGAPAATEKLLNGGRICYSVGYNVDMLETAPNAALTSATNNWAAYYTEAFKAAMDGKAVPANWAEGYTKNAVGITKLGSSCAAGTADYVADVEAKLKDGSLKIFDTATFTVSAPQNTCTVETDASGKVTSCKVDLSFMDFATMTAIYKGDVVECIKDGAFEESEFRSAPYFSIRIDGIVEDAAPVE
ncbi:MAG: BMP family ABC transporter substrate-binding protein [Lachnospiraceae bacterium]|nr:BMP family ABC transporter substrate-binding protein [Lachnospiraceae bacterium]